MTLMIILGGVAALYLIWLLFRLAAIALPVYAAIGAGLFLHVQGYSIAAVLGVGFITGLLIHLTGQAVFASVRSPVLRWLVGLLFAAPAGFAGYQAMTGLFGLVGDGGIWVNGLAVGASLATASAAWRSLGSAASISGAGELRPQGRATIASPPQG